MKIGLFFRFSNFGLVISGKVIYDIVLDALMIDLLTLGNGGKFLC